MTGHELSAGRTVAVPDPVAEHRPGHQAVQSRTDPGGHPKPRPAPHPRTLWRLAIRDGHTGLHDMAWVAERYRQLLAEYGYPETSEPGEQLCGCSGPSHRDTCPQFVMPI